MLVQGQLGASFSLLCPLSIFVSWSECYCTCPRTLQLQSTASLPGLETAVAWSHFSILSFVLNLQIWSALMRGEIEASFLEQNAPDLCQSTGFSLSKGLRIQCRREANSYLASWREKKKKNTAHSQTQSQSHIS